MIPRATIVVPTHDQLDTLPRTLQSACAQTVDDLEILVVADGTPEAMRKTLLTACAVDPRIRCLELPKGAHHGEVNRARALSEARAAIVCYLDDEDLLFPDHVGEVIELLKDADFAHVPPLRAETDGRVGAYLANVEDRRCRALMRRGINQVPLTCGAHTLRAYNALARGWTVAPPGMASDLWLWLAFIDSPGVRCRSGGKPTSIHFPSWPRRGFSRAWRVAEQASWHARIASSGGAALVQADAAEPIARARRSAALGVPAWGWRLGRTLLRAQGGHIYRRFAETLLGSLPR